MIIDLNLDAKTVVIIGAGKEALKRINTIIDQNSKIIVIGENIHVEISELSKNKRIQVLEKRVENPNFLTELKPDIIITTTDNKKINEKILEYAKNKRILAYSSDNPEKSDFANPAIINFKEVVQLAIFTGGRSPAMSRQIKGKIETMLDSTISNVDIEQIKIQKIARELAKNEIPTQNERKKCLNAIVNNKEIDQLIKDGQMKKAEKLAIKILKEWK